MVEFLIGIVHRTVAYMHDDYEIIGGVFNPDKAISLEFAEEIDIPTNRTSTLRSSLKRRQNYLKRTLKWSVF